MLYYRWELHTENPKSTINGDGKAETEAECKRQTLVATEGRPLTEWKKMNRLVWTKTDENQQLLLSIMELKEFKSENL